MKLWRLSSAPIVAESPDPEAGGRELSLKDQEVSGLASGEDLKRRAGIAINITTKIRSK
jgi:hypothetical protein